MVDNSLTSQVLTLSLYGAYTQLVVFLLSTRYPQISNRNPNDFLLFTFSGRKLQNKWNLILTWLDYTLYNFHLTACYTIRKSLHLLYW